MNHIYGESQNFNFYFRWDNLNGLKNEGVKKTAHHLWIATKIFYFAFQFELAVSKLLTNSFKPTEGVIIKFIDQVGLMVKCCW